MKAGLQSELDNAANTLREQLASAAQVQADLHSLHAAELSAAELRLAEAEKINQLHKEKNARENVGGTVGGAFGARLEAIHNKVR